MSSERQAFNDGFDKGYARAQEYTAQLEAEYKRLSKKYYELVFAVANKHPDETRHETALRYIREREQRISGPSKASDAFH